MIFSSLVFLTLFLPITVLVYYLIPRKYRNLFLLLASLFFYAWGEPVYVLIMLFSTVFDYINGRMLEHFEGRQQVRKWILVLSLTGNLGILCFFKYTDFFLTNINQIFSTDLGLLSLALPIGISFYTFQTLSYTIDVYRGNVKAQHNLMDFAMYVCLFPQLVAGPIVRYTTIEQELHIRHESADMIWQGLSRFIIGLGKKVLLANQIGILWEEIQKSNGILPAGTAWLGAIAYAFQIYFDFSGYSDMAIGLGLLFGFHFPENFTYPYEAESITDFWRRWHQTLSSWFREYLYIPLGGNRKGTARMVLNLLIVWCLTGFWHGADWNFILWGLYYFILLVLEKLVFNRIIHQMPLFFRHLITLFWILFGWVLFSCEQLNVMIQYIQSLFGIHGGWNSETWYDLRSYGFLLLILTIGCTSLPKRAVNFMKKKINPSETVQFVVQTIFIVCILSVSIIFLVGNSYNPFLYFRF